MINKTKNSVRKLFTFLLNLIFPENKIKKEKILKEINEKNIFLNEKFEISFFNYSENISKIIKDLKFYNKKDNANFLGEILYENLIKILEDAKNFHNFENPKIIIVPISKKRLRERFYNQNDLIIKSFLNLGGGKFCQYEKNNLIKIKETIPQSKTKNRSERLKNVKGSFSLKDPEKIKNQNIILFDDIKTSGATLAECEKILKKAKIKKILKITLTS